MKACVKVFAAKATGAGVQTVTGVVDHNGDPFVGTIFIFEGNCEVNTLKFSTGNHVTALNRSWGQDLVATGVYTRNGSDFDEFPTNGFKDVKTLNTASTYSVLMFAGALISGTTTRAAYVSDSRSGEFDITYDINSVTGDVIFVTILGGDDLLFQTANLASTSISTPFRPVGALFRTQGRFEAGGQIGDGGRSSIGWATSDDVQGTSGIDIITQGGNRRSQRTNLCYQGLNGGGSQDIALDSWNSAGFELDAIPGGSGTRYTAFGGVQAACGSFLQKSSTGHQTITTGIQNRIVFFATMGSVVSGSILTDRAEQCIGLMAANAQGCYWGGEDAVDDLVNGTRYLSNADVILIGAAAKGATTFTGRAQFFAFDAAGTFTLNWSVTDGTARQILWFALGDSVAPVEVTGLEVNCAVSPHTITVIGAGFDPDASVTLTGPPDGDPVAFTIQSLTPTEIILGDLDPSFSNGEYCVEVTNPEEDPVGLCETLTCDGPTTESLLIRWERIFSHVSQQQKWIFYANFQLDIETGVGLLPGDAADPPVQGSDPVIFLSWSDDGGHTYCQERTLGMGKIGQFKYRCRLPGPMGRSRDRVFKIAGSDPVPISILAAYVDVEQGLS